VAACTSRSWLPCSRSTLLSIGELHQRAQEGVPAVRIEVRIDTVRKCAHVNLVRKTNVAGEEEYLTCSLRESLVAAAWRLVCTCPCCLDRTRKRRRRAYGDNAFKKMYE
jgi:hypothetical protein